MNEPSERALDPAEIRAAKRPGVIAAVYLGHLALGLFLAMPVARLVADVTGSYPRSDALLFDPGAVFLVDALRLLRSGLESIAVFAVLVGLAAAVFGLFPLAALLHALGHSGRMDLPELARASARSFRALAGLLAFASIAWAVLLLAALLLVAALSDRVETAVGPLGGTATTLGVLVLAASMGACVGVLHDLARAAVVEERLSALGGLRRARAALRLRARSALASWGGRALGSLALIAFGAALAWKIGVATNTRVGLLWAVHQAVIVGVLVLRASWLAAALRLVRSVRDEDGVRSY